MRSGTSCRVAFRITRRNEEWPHVCGPVPLARAMPTGIVHEDGGDSAGRDVACDLVDLLMHGAGVGVRQDQCCADITRREDGTEDVSTFIALIDWLTRLRFARRPLTHAVVILAKPHLVPEPGLDRGLAQAAGQRLRECGGSFV
jgi:hypothetical protein